MHARPDVTGWLLVQARCCSCVLQRWLRSVRPKLLQQHCMSTSPTYAHVTLCRPTMRSATHVLCAGISAEEVVNKASSAFIVSALQ